MTADSYLKVDGGREVRGHVSLATRARVSWVRVSVVAQNWVMCDVSPVEAATPGRMMTERIGPTFLCPYEQEPLLLKRKLVVRGALLVEDQSMRRAATLIVRRDVCKMGLKEGQRSTQ